ncbi:MAG: hypothetical protein HUU32_20855 [Calditrichaceae bacterium]|nr:hypothetical protein [Calditrichia bacterium]NUQ43849.1 hypothetical protein [Calditrichaceae bacterium]
MVAGIVICHSLLAFELVNAAQKILGRTEFLYPFSNDNMAPGMILQNLTDTLKRNESRQIIAMVDLRGGSCWAAAKMLTREFPETRVLSGVNIPMLISFLTKRDKFPFEELPKILESDALRGITAE